jgi:Tfp pilus assembly protein PilF
MPINRVEALQSMLAADPSNTFARYGLAMELLNSGSPDSALAEFQSLLATNPDYVAAYFHGGQTLEKLGRIDDARSMYQRGIESATRTGDAHTRSELEAALDLLPK